MTTGRDGGGGEGGQAIAAKSRDEGRNLNVDGPSICLLFHALCCKIQTEKFNVQSVLFNVQSVLFKVQYVHSKFKKFIQSSKCLFKVPNVYSKFNMFIQSSKC